MKRFVTVSLLMAALGASLFSSGQPTGMKAKVDELSKSARPGQEESFRWVFGNLTNFDDSLLRQVLSAPPGRRHYVDRNHDGKPEEVWFVDISPRHNAANRPMLVRVLDEDGDLVMGGEPDTDSDLYLADWKGDGTLNAVLDYQDDDGDQDVDQMAFYFYDKNWGLRSWWGRDDGDDNLLWYDIDYTYYQRQCEMYSHFGGDETFVSFYFDPLLKTWKSIWENPFLFYDCDHDDVAEEVMRIEADNEELYSVRWSFDADDDASPDSPRDFDVSVSSFYGGSTTLKFRPAGDATSFPRYPVTPLVSENVSLRGFQTMPFLRRNVARDFLNRVTPERIQLAWDENDLNIAWDNGGIVRTMERWEGIIAAPSGMAGFEMPVIGGPNCGAFNKRYELILSPNGPPQYYYNPSDRRIHLRGSDKTWLSVDFDYDGKPEMLYAWNDSDRDGLAETVILDADGDGVTDDTWFLDCSRISPVGWRFDDIVKYQGRVVAEEPSKLHKLNILLMNSLEKLKAGAGADDVWNLLNSGFIRNNIPSEAALRLAKSNETVMYYLMLSADRRTVALKKLHSSPAFWKTYDELRGKGDICGLTDALSREFDLDLTSGYEEWVEKIRKQPSKKMVSWNNTWFPPNWGWESEKAAYRCYDGHFDLFGKRLDTLIYPDITKGKSYHSDVNGWGMDILHVGKTGGLGGLVLYVDGKAYPVRNDGGQGDPIFSARLVRENNREVVLEFAASGVGPASSPFTVFFRVSIEAGRSDSRVEVFVSGGDPHSKLDLGIALTRIGQESYYLDRRSGIMASWGIQQPDIGQVGLGVMFPAGKYLRSDDQPDEHRIVLAFSRSQSMTYHIQGDWLRGHRFSCCSGAREWFDNLKINASGLNLSHQVSRSSQPGTDFAAVRRANVLGIRGTYYAPPRMPNGHVDNQKLLAALIDLGANTYNWLIWEKESDWEDLQSFLPMALQNGIDVWVSLVPPSESKPMRRWSSEPFQMDYLRWAEEVSRLSLLYPNLKALSIDDYVGYNLQFYTPAFTSLLVERLRDINPRLAFVPCVYYHTASKPDFVKKYASLFDGILYPYKAESSGKETLSTTGFFISESDSIRQLWGPDFPLILDIYSTRHSKAGESTPSYVKDMIKMGSDRADGIFIYKHPDEKADAEKYFIIRKEYKRWKK